jgi:amino acid transporter
MAAGNGANDDAIVAGFGYKQELRRSLGLFSMFGISFSIISITIGIYLNFGVGISHFGPAAIWTWPIVVVGQLLLATVLAELGSRIPLAGYSYQWAARLAGPGLGWLVAVIIFSGFTLASAAEALLLIAPLLASVLNLDATNTLLMTVISVVVFIAVAAINIASVWLTARINNLSVATEVLGTGVLGLILLVAFLIHPNHSVSFLFTTGNLNGNPAWYAFVLAMLMGLFTITGFEGAADLGEEGVGVRRTVPRAIIGSVAISGIVGMLTLFCVALAIPNLEKTVADPAPIYYITTYWLGPIVSKILIVTIIYSVFAALVVNMAAMGRLVYSLSRDNMLPGSKFLVRVNPTTRTPVNAIGLMFVLFTAVLVFAATQPDAYVILIAAGTPLYYFAYLVIVVAYGFRRGRLSHLPTGFNLGRWAMPAFVITSLWLVAAILLIALPSDYRAGDYVAGVILALGIGWYLVGLRGKIRRGEAGTSLVKPAGVQVAPAGPAK